MIAACWKCVLSVVLKVIRHIIYNDRAPNTLSTNGLLTPLTPPRALKAMPKPWAFLGWTLTHALRSKGKGHACFSAPWFIFAFILRIIITGSACANVTLAKAAEKGKRWRVNEMLQMQERASGSRHAFVCKQACRGQGGRQGQQLPRQGRDRAVTSAKGCSGPAGFVIPPALDTQVKISLALPDFLYEGE